MAGANKPFVIPIQIRYADIDSLQHVNNARYFTFMEQARSEYFRQLGLWDGGDMRKLGVILARTACDFLRPIRYGDSLEVKAETVELGSKSFQMMYELRDDQAELFATGEATLVCFDYEEQRPIAIPSEWRKKLTEFEGLAG